MVQIYKFHAQTCPGTHKQDWSRWPGLIWSCPESAGAWYRPNRPGPTTRTGHSGRPVGASGYRCTGSTGAVAIKGVSLEEETWCEAFAVLLRAVSHSIHPVYSAWSCKDGRSLLRLPRPSYIGQNSSTFEFLDTKVDSFLSVFALPSGSPHGISLQTQGLTYTGIHP